MSGAAKLSPLEWQVKQSLQDHGICDGLYLIAVSGGLDSMCLLAILNRLKAKLNVELAVSCVFHGWSKQDAFDSSWLDVNEVDRIQDQFRRNSWNMVRQSALNLGIPFYSNIESPEQARFLAPQGEAALRALRLDHWRKLMPKLAQNHAAGRSWLVLAHHRDDLLETQLLRLMRGTGAEGFARALPFQRGSVIRPLLAHDRVTLKRYAQLNAIEWLDDPSNRELGALRNWLRQFWLPELERKRPGACRSLSRSFELLAEMAAELLAESLKSKTVGPLESVTEQNYAKGLLMPQFLALNPADQRRELAKYMSTIGIKNYTRGHIDEIIKRVASPRRHLVFRSAGYWWHVNPERLAASAQKENCAK